MRLKTFLYSLLKLLLSFVQLAFLVVVLFIIYSIYKDYNPPEKEQLFVQESEQASTVKHDSTFSFLIWNIGYAGLGAEMDFFYDGGKQTRAGQPLHQRYHQGIEKFLKANDSIDFLLLQEVDRHSKRTYYHNQVAALRKVLPGYHSVFSKNYDVPFVPLPVFNPLGRVKAGMMTFSKHPADNAMRLSLPQAQPWPQKYFMLDRAVLVTTHALPQNRKLVVMNIHNSAYADDKEALKEETAIIRKYAREQQQAGHVVVIGGDWNQNPPDFEAKASEAFFSLDYQLSDTLLGERWEWAWSRTKPTNRSLAEPYNSSTPETVIDFFVASPGLQVKEVKVLEMGFEFSDHEPVYLRVKLTPPKRNQK